MNIIIILEIVKYVIFAAFLFSGTTVLYRALTPKDLRETHRLRFKEKVRSNAEKTKQKVQNISFDERLKEAGLPFINSYRYEVFRVIIFLIYITNYMVLPAVNGQGFNFSSLSVLLLIWIVTEYRLDTPVNLVNILLNILTAGKQRKKSIELFTLYDILKSDLQALHKNQSVNVYNLLKDSLPMFKHIDGTLSRFLSTVLTNPKAAEKIFYEDIKTPGAKTIGEIIVKIDNINRNEALEVIKTESTAYSQHFFKEEFREGQRRKIRLNALFTITILINIAWLIAFITSMLMIQWNSSNIL